MAIMRSLVVFLAAFPSVTTAFAPAQTVSRPSVALNAVQDDFGRKAAVSVFAAAFLAANVAATAPAFAWEQDFGSSTVISARSGGRGGGRASSPRPARSPSSSSKTVYRSSTTYVQPSPTVIVSPGYGYGYNPLGGFGLGYGLGAMNDIGNTMRDYRQESEIQESRSELQQARMKEAELEARLRQLEAAQGAK